MHGCLRHRSLKVFHYVWGTLNKFLRGCNFVWQTPQMSFQGDVNLKMLWPCWWICGRYMQLVYIVCVQNYTSVMVKFQHLRSYLMKKCHNNSLYQITLTVIHLPWSFIQNLHALPLVIIWVWEGWVIPGRPSQYYGCWCSESSCYVVTSAVWYWQCKIGRSFT